MDSGLANADTIAAIATPPGRGGVGIVRISGTKAEHIAKQLLGQLPHARTATYLDFKDLDGSLIDQGIALFFPGPDSFTGEDILELQGHGGPVVMEMLLTRVVGIGGRIARPGEFTERAFLNNKIDLSQAEAIADLIDSTSQRAVKGAMRSLQGEFSRKIRNLDEKVVEIRIYIEASLDFPEEEVDFLSHGKIKEAITGAAETLTDVLRQANEGALLREGVTLVLSGRPNAGKSSLMNQLSGRDSSIVTRIPGTTRDLVNEFIHLDGIPLNLIDTAGIRRARDEAEEEGVRRALNEIDRADGVVILVDLPLATDWQQEVSSLISELPANRKVVVALNKVDLLNGLPEIPVDYPYAVVFISAKLGWGLEELKSTIKQTLAVDLSEEGCFIARTRHIDALTRARFHLQLSQAEIAENGAGELIAEELRLCHEALCEITGEFSSDDLLGRIFSSFCIGK